MRHLVEYRVQFSLDDRWFSSVRAMRKAARQLVVDGLADKFEIMPVSSPRNLKVTAVVRRRKQ